MALRDYRGLLADKVSSVAHLATKDKVGLVKPDNDTITVSADGTIKAKGGSGSIPIASDTVLGGIKVGQNLSITSDGTLSASGGGGEYTLPIASQETLGGIKVGDNLSIDADGVLSATGGSSELPIATADTLGGIKIGQNLSITPDGVLSSTGGGSGGGIDYSLEEQDTGLKWIDGKKIYQKTYYFEKLNLVYGAKWVTLTSIADLGIDYNNPVFIDGIIMTSDSYWTLNTYRNYTLTGVCVNVTKPTNPTPEILRATSYGSDYNIFNNSPTYITLKYTKTTD